tara:strand:- start:19 stop:369 length:351 start_codon:yes stop_codon:yes gene_type:complete
MEETNEAVFEEVIEMTPEEGLIQALHGVIGTSDLIGMVDEVREDVESLEGRCGEIDDAISNLQEVHDSLVDSDTLEEAITNALETVEAPILEARIEQLEITMMALASVFEDFTNGL